MIDEFDISFLLLYLFLFSKHIKIKKCVIETKARLFTIYFFLGFFDHFCTPVHTVEIKMAGNRFTPSYRRLINICYSKL